MPPGKLVPAIGARPPDLRTPDRQVTHQHRLRQRPGYLEIGAKFLLLVAAITCLTSLDPGIVMACDIGAGYPRELAGVASNLNALLVGERKRVARYRDTLGNLAHSLKTPLAVMRASLPGQQAAGAVSTEIDRMSGIIEHQLKRAAASGGALLGQAPVDVAQVAAELRVALLKVYADKDLSIELAVAAGTQFIGDRGDLTELLGNLLDNACKWCRSRVRLGAALVVGAGLRERLSVVVEDDGPGISAQDRARVLERGVRADEKVPGHGLGLSMVHDTVDMYGGWLGIDSSPFGGARFSLRLPGSERSR